jgi:cytochrome P450
MTRFLWPIVQRRIDMVTSQSGSAKAAGNTGRTVLDLSVRALEDEESTTVPEGFVMDTIGNINTFLFAGHDTTGTTICWALHLLERNPRVLARVRDELNSVFGPAHPGTQRASDSIMEQLRANPNLANNLPYTHAVVKETLRVYTNVGTLRQGNAHFFLYGPHGSVCEGMAMPTEGFIVWDGSYAIHTRPDLWERVDEALPERWLFGDNDDGEEKEQANGDGRKEKAEADRLRPPSNGWRPFAAGPRNCIGQHLAIMEVKLVLALVCREFDVECAWEEWDRMR